MLEIRDLEAAYGDARALSGVTLTVGPGEIVALLGPNGASKSTLFKDESPGRLRLGAPSGQARRFRLARRRVHSHNHRRTRPL